MCRRNLRSTEPERIRLTNTRTAPQNTVAAADDDDTASARHTLFASRSNL